MSSYIVLKTEIFLFLRSVTLHQVCAPYNTFSKVNLFHLFLAKQACVMGVLSFLVKME